jgi:hypothetical protein
MFEFVSRLVHDVIRVLSLREQVKRPSRSPSEVPRSSFGPNSRSHSYVAIEFMHILQIVPLQQLSSFTFKDPHIVFRDFETR